MSDSNPSHQPASARLEAAREGEHRGASTSVGGDLTDEQIAALEQFIARLGGIENARFAVELLAEAERAA